MKMFWLKKFIFLLSLLLCCNLSLFSIAVDWTVDSNGNWNTNTNWNPTTVPNAAIDVASFPNILSDARVVTVNGTFDVAALNFLSFNPYTLSGGMLNLFTSIHVNAPAATASHVINTALALQGGLTITNVTAIPLTISGVISGAQPITIAQGTTILTGANTYTGPTMVAAGATLQGTTVGIQGNVTNDGTVTFDQTTTGTYGGVISGGGDLTFDGTGTVTFTSNQTYTGNTEFKAGILQVSAVGQLGLGTTLTFNGGALQTTASISDNHPTITLAGNGTINTDTGTTLEITGIIGGVGALIKVGGGVFDVGSSAHTYTGGTQINNGTLRINNLNSLSSNQVSMNGGTLNNTATFSLANTFTLANTSTIDTDAGTLTLNGTVNGTGAFLKTGPGVLDMGVGSNSYSGGTEIKQGTLRINANDNLGTGLITFDGGTLNSTADITENSNFFMTPSSGIFDVNAATTLALGSNISGPGGLIKTGGGTLNLGAGINNYSGGTQINAGFIQINANGSLGTNLVAFNGGTLRSTFNLTYALPTLLNTGTFSVAGGTTLNWNGAITGGGVLNKIGSGTLVLGGTSSYTGGSVVTSGTLEGTTLSIPGDVTTALDAALVFNQNFDGTYTGRVSGAGDLRKQGTGTIILTNVATNYTGETQFSGGTLQISHITQIGTGIRRFNGGALATTASMADSINYVFDGDGVFNIGAGTIFNLNGTINASLGRLIKTGTGALDLGGNVHGYAGGTEISQGTLIINANGNLGTGPVNFNGGTLNAAASVTIPQGGTLTTIGTIDVDSGLALNWNGTVNGTGALIKQGTGTLVLTGNNGYSGGTTVSTGTLQGTTNGIQGNILNHSVLDFTQGFAGVYAGSIIGTGSVDVNGGTVTFSGFNNYTGGTNIITGTLIGTTNSFRGAFANAAAGTLTFDQIFDGAFQGTISGAGALFKEGAGTVSINGNQSLTGLTTINGGTLNLNGTLNGDVLVNAGGIFSGTNQINNLTNNGMVVVGNGLGQINVIGNYVQNATRNLNIEVDTAGNNDLLTATGNANLNGALNITLLPGLYNGDELYTILTAGTVVPGFSSSSSSVGAPVNIFYLPVGLPTFVQINVAFRGSVLPASLNVLTPNARHIAEYLFCPGFVPESADLFFVMQSLLTLPPDVFIKELDQLGPALFGALPLTDLQNNYLVAGTIAENTEKYSWCNDCNNLDKCPSKKRETTIWVAPVGQWQTQRGYEEQIGFNTRTYGISAGAAHLFLPWMQFGGGVGYTYTDLGWKRNGGDGHWHSVYVGPMLGFVTSNWYLNLLAQGSASFYSIDRKVVFPGVNKVAHNHHHSYGVLGRLDSGYKITFVTVEDYPMSFIPTVRLSYLNIFEEGYTESGAGSINLKVDGKTTTYLQPEFLIKVLREIYFSSFCFSSAFQIGWIANIPLSSATYAARFAIDETFCRTDFTVQTFDKTTNQLTFGLGFVLKKIEQYQIGISYEGRAFDRHYVNSAKIHVDWKF